jgi:hypothetical protein
MTDRELLELAAKAAGIERGADRFDGGISITDITGRHRSLPKWNPLADDGDALRLACILRITPHIDSNLTEAEWAGRGCGGFILEPHNNDPAAATRRAIVRAAAEIGKAMK